MFGQLSVRESHVGKSGCSHLEVLVVCHHEIFHNALPGSHNVHGVGGLVGAEAEEVLGRELAEEVHQTLCLDVVVFDECLYAVAVLLAAHVLMGREVGHDVEALLLAEDALKDRVAA